MLHIIGGLYLGVGLVSTCMRWRKFRQAVIADGPSVYQVLPPPWACWVLLVLLWPVSFGVYVRSCYRAWRSKA